MTLDDLNHLPAFRQASLISWIEFLRSLYVFLRTREFSSTLGLWHCKMRSTPAAFLFSFFSLELNGSCTVYPMPYYSCYHFAPKMFSSYSITLSLRFNVKDMLFTQPLTLTFWCAAQIANVIWCLETVVLCGKNGWFVNLSL